MTMRATVLLLIVPSAFLVATVSALSGQRQVASVTATPATGRIQVGETVQLSATPKDASGNSLTGRLVTWATSSGVVATVSASGLVTGAGAGTATITAVSEGRSGTATATVAPTPDAVTDLAVASVTDSSVTLAFTEVTDGAGRPASYMIRFDVGALSWVAATQVRRGSCATPVAGSAIGARRMCTVQGLAAGTVYQFQLVAFHGTLNVDAVFGTLSNVASILAPPTVRPLRRPLAGAQHSILATLPRAAVAIAVPAIVRQDSVVVVRLILDPRGSTEALRDSMTSEGAAGMHVKRDTARYASSMTALLSAPGADVVRVTPAVVAVPSKGVSGWTWVLRPTRPGRQQLWVILTATELTRTGAEAQVYLFDPYYTISRDPWRTLNESRFFWLVVTAAVSASITIIVTRLLTPKAATPNTRA